ncbi:hypothetical protein BN1723_006282, partial [Verticillium longisporum]
QIETQQPDFHHYAEGEGRQKLHLQQLDMNARLRWLTARPFLTDFSKRLLGYATWIPVVIMFNNYVAEIHNVHGPSMYPFFNEDYNSSLLQDKVLTWKWWPQYDLERGMIVTFRSPNNPEAISIKRIMAVEGDVVRTKAPYPEPVARVPQGHIWVEGDGDKTIDSNTYGPVPMSLVTGKVTHFLYPLKKFGPIRWWEHKGRER